MTADDIKSISLIEKLVTNRKISADKTSKVEWLKIQWLRFQNVKSFIIQYKYSNNIDFLFQEVDISKRNSSKFVNLELEPLYPGGRFIEAAKFKDLQELKEFIPPIKHAFYNNLKTNSRAEEEDIQEEDE